ncbi:MAG: Asp-tRNA(Asn)/Glu-tRNA(Gln) amidotransferase GatCAB subunit A, partial [Gammaproteobacteria bacterium]|nr:Asp-tRNA(Asn)/Glu-tRNA(Gln) amidotransferase GatCAB subunit A [Gammaproteobacteria bacterium]
MHNKTIAELVKSLASGEFSSEELTRLYLDRINQLGKQLNCYITVTAEQALQQARAADQRRAKGNAHPLAGVPLAHKDIFCTDGVKTSCGSKMLDNFIAPYDATVVTRCKQAGMVMLGKTNMDEFAMGSSNETSFYGPVKNPWN